MAAPHTGWRLWIALAAIGILLGQGFASASAHAAGQGLAVVDAFGNPLCLAGHGANPQDDRGRGGTTDCCALLCGISASLGLVPKAPGMAAPAQPEPAGRSLAGTPFTIAEGGYRPGNPRGPPLFP